MMETVIAGVMATALGLTALNYAIKAVSRYVCPVDGQRFMFRRELESHLAAVHGAGLIDILWNGSSFASPPVFEAGSQHIATTHISGLPEYPVAGLNIGGPARSDIKASALSTFEEDRADFEIAMPLETGSYLVSIDVYSVGSLVRRLYYFYRISVV